MTEPMNGKFYWRALAYAHKAVPSDDAGSRLQHISFIGHRIIGADGERWHVGLLPEDVDLPPMAVARGCVQSLLLGLEYAWRMSKRNSGDFSVRQDDEHVVIEYGAPHPIDHALVKIDTGRGKLPAKWKEPVRANAPVLEGNQSSLRCGHMLEAMKWYRAWDTDHGTFTLRGDGGASPVRVDLTAGGELVANAFLLPVDHPPAQLPADEPLLAGEKAKSQSNLDLELPAVAPNGERAKPHKKGKKAEAEASGQ
jgi:hypothetical protein